MKGGDFTSVGVREFDAGNPVISSGPFYDSFSVNREAWSLFTIGAFDTPNLAGLELRPIIAQR